MSVGFLLAPVDGVFGVLGVGGWGRCLGARVLGLAVLVIAGLLLLCLVVCLG